ncbi:unnamed protein product [Cyclocybe aegerita]|uniref:Beta-lactamase-related domain-containing protein n=1 Tax=Cyclocybe aegerita TaxID=1973307 RepID=A0A8S0VS55_CYCAE|nr:unnamed protein product [Cyclocybe aegerita]
MFRSGCVDREADQYLLRALLGEDEVGRPPTKFDYWMFKFSIRFFFLTALSLFALAGTALYYALYLPEDFFGGNLVETTLSSDICKAPNPNIFGYHPLRASNEAIAKAAHSLDNYLSQRASKPDIDSISIAVVSAAGTLFEGGYGTLRANETDEENQRPVDRDSIYRIASITKMFTVLETLILRETGALNWDDPVTNYVPDFSPPAYGWADFLVEGSANANQGEPERITLRQLASHLGGIGRDYPPHDIGEWPTTTTPWGALVKSARGEPLPNRTYENIMKALNQYPLVNVPYEYPIYSNIGFDLLGLANVAANQKASIDPKAEPQTHEELLKRDIFDHMGLTSSFYRVPESPLRDHIAVPSSNSEWADVWLGDTDDAAGGQYSSLKDLTAVMKSLLSPTRTVREWLRPLYVWGSTEQQVGAPWEIFPLPGGAKAYTKGGNLPGYHSEFALVPEYSYGMIVLVTGTYENTLTILNEVATRFHPAITQQYRVGVQRRYAGTWTNGKDTPGTVLEPSEVGYSL